MTRPSKWILSLICICLFNSILCATAAGKETPYEIASGLRATLWCATGMLIIALNETRRKDP